MIGCMINENKITMLIQALCNLIFMRQRFGCVCISVEIQYIMREAESKKNVLESLKPRNGEEGQIDMSP